MPARRIFTAVTNLLLVMMGGVTLEVGKYRAAIVPLEGTVRCAWRCIDIAAGLEFLALHNHAASEHHNAVRGVVGVSWLDVSFWPSYQHIEDVVFAVVP